MQKQINKLDFNGQNIYSGIDTHKNQWTITVMVEDRLLCCKAREASSFSK